MTHGRGAWPNSGLGGTKAYKSSNAGPYYYLGSGELDPKESVDNYAVRHAVIAYQRALNRRLGKGTVEVTGKFDKSTSDAVTAFQQKHTDLVTPWGGIGQDTSFLLLYPDLVKECNANAHAPLTSVVVSGIIRHESSWDAGAVGYVDPQDFGLAQINGPSHPSLTDSERFQPKTAFEFVVSYMNNALGQLNNNLTDAIAAYNLGIGGARDWISKGRPQMYTPKGATEPRDVLAYIGAVLAG